MISCSPSRKAIEKGVKRECWNFFLKKVCTVSFSMDLLAHDCLCLHYEIACSLQTLADLGTTSLIIESLSGTAMSKRVSFGAVIDKHAHWTRSADN